MGPAVLASCGLAGVMFFWPGLVSLASAWATPEYSHGPLVPLVSAFLFLREMRHVPPVSAPVADTGPGLLFVAAGLALGAVGRLASIADLVTYGLILWIAGVVLVCFGWRRGRAFWPSVLHLVFMLPLPQFLFWRISVDLQLVSSQLGVALIQAAGMPVFLDGNVIDLGIYKLQVAEACNGLSYLFPLLSFTYTFAVLYRGPVWHKVLLLSLALPITVAMNSLRIGVIGIMVRTHGVGYAEGFLHFFEGWVIFLACVALLVAAAWLLQRMQPAPLPLAATLDLDFDGVSAQARRVRDVQPTRALAIIGAATLALAFVFGAPRDATASVPRDSFALAPTVVAGRSATWTTFDPEIERVLGADDYVSAIFHDPELGPPIDLFAAFYESQTAGKGIHSPKVCLPTDGWEVSHWRTETVSLPDGGRIPVNRAVIAKGADRKLVYFWFEQRGRRMTNDVAVKLVAVLDTLLTGRSDGGLVRIITPLVPGEPEGAADGRLVAFMADLAPQLARHFPP